MDPATQGRHLRRRVGYVSQLHSLYQDLSVEQNLRFFGSMYGLGKEELEDRLEAELARFHLQSQRRELVARQPTGVQRRTALAAALLHRPELLILDEPTSGMDAAARREFWTFLGGLAGEGATVIITTHHLEEAEACDRLSLMLAGRVRFEGTPGGMRGAFSGPVLRVRAEPWADSVHGAERGLRSFVCSAARCTWTRVGGTKARSGRCLAERGLEVLALEERPPTMEDAFLRAAEGAGGRSR